MNKTYILTGVLVVLIVGAGYFSYSRSHSSSEQPSSPSNVTEEKLASVDQVDPAKADTRMSSKPGVYKDYTQDAISTTAGTKLLFFHAPWCPQCRELDESIQSSDLPEDTTVFKVDYDTNKGLREKYGVTIQTTIVKVDDNGNKVSSYVAYQSPTFDNVRAALLK